ncbi:MAG: hypothetical protein SFV21_18520 [Rhodospirillaceae bacterium]|nr:hypothetical protein [Rhodospirillaceae bacterium]
MLKRPFSRRMKWLMASGLIGASALAGAGVYAADGRGFNPERLAERAKARCERLAEVDRKLTATQVKEIIEGRLAERGQSNLKVGKAEDKPGGVISIEIVTASGSLVNVRELSAKTGLPVGAEARCAEVAERITKAVESGEFDRRRGAGRRGGGGDEFGLGLGGDPMMDGRMRGGRMGARLGELALIGNVGPDRDLSLTKDQARQLAESGLILLGNPRLKVGEVIEKDADTYVVNIVTADNALVLTREIDRHTGRVKRDAR